MANNYKNKKQNSCCDIRKIKEIGFILLVFGMITICAFFLPLKAWIVLLGIVFIVCGIRLLR